MKEGAKISSWHMNGAVEDNSDRGFGNGDSKDFQYDSSDDFIMPTQGKKSILNPKLTPVTESILDHKPVPIKKVVLKGILTPERSSKKKVVLFQEKSEHLYLESSDDDVQSASTPASTPEPSHRKKIVLKSILASAEPTPKRKVVLFQEKTEQLDLENSDDDVKSASVEYSNEDNDDNDDTYNELFQELNEEETVIINERVSTMGRRMEDEKISERKKEIRARPSLFTLRSRYGSELLACVETVTYPDDCYSFMSIHGPKEGYFWFGFMVFMFQMTFFLLMICGVVTKKWSTSSVNDNPSLTLLAQMFPTDSSPLVRGSQIMSLLTYVIFADASMSDMITAIHTFPNFRRVTSRDKVWCMVISCTLRFMQGLLAMVVAIILVFISNDVIEVILNFTALNFISALDDVAFEFAKSGKYGILLEKEVKRIEELPLPVCMFRKYKSVRYLYTIIPLLITVIAIFIMIVSMQVGKLGWDTQILRVQFGDTGLQDYSGCYQKLDGSKLYKRAAYVKTDHNNDRDVRFDFCIDSHQWYLHEGGELPNPCKLKKEDVIIRSSETVNFDVSSLFNDGWYTPNGKMADLYFFVEKENVISESCGAFLNDGNCDAIFNNIDYNYDGGDCCAATCESSVCSIGGLENAFGSINTTGDGYSNCDDPGMVPLTIRLEGFTNSRDPKLLELSKENRTYIEESWPSFWDEEPTDARLSLSCDGTKILKFDVNDSMENQNETVMVSDGADCEIHIKNATSFNSDWSDDPLWYVNYTVYLGHEGMMTNSTSETLILQEYSYDNSVVSFDIIPKCYFEKLSDHIDRMNVHMGNNPSSKAINWLMRDESEESDCKLEAFLTRYILSVLNFAAPIDPSISLNGLWIQEKEISRWPNILCIGDLAPKKLGYFQLDLSDLGISGYIATEIGLLSNLASYDTSNNMLIGSIPSEIGSLTSLSFLNLNENELTGSIPSEIGLLTALTMLSIKANDLSGSIPSEIGILTALTSLSLEKNRLIGSIPSEIGLLKHLKQLDLYSSGVSGSIPSEIGLLTSLTSLSFSGNALTGSIPTEIGLLSFLSFLNIDENSLTGSIPTEIGLLSFLSFLNIYENSLTGSIPSEIGLLSSLSFLNIDENSLTGSVPTEIEALTALKRLQIDDNLMKEEHFSTSVATKVAEQCILCNGTNSYKLVGSANSTNTNDVLACSSIFQVFEQYGKLIIDECDQLRNQCIVCKGLEGTIEDSRLNSLEPIP